MNTTWRSGPNSAGWESDRPRIPPFRSGDKHRDAQAVPDLVHRLAEHQVAEQAVAVGAHDQQVDRLPLELLDELARPIGTMEQDRVGLVALLPEDLHDTGQVA